ncbi:MAG: 30S ribosomal protein S13 [Candidatus Aenigmatarchaeota archaeon]|nr:MAG: 30S ribosomal protein S13 [Candidatus Aenigmarchaeota archaeon]
MGSDSDLKKLEAKLRKKGEATTQDKPEKGKEQEKPKGKPESKAVNIIRMAETNLDGTKNVFDAIRDVKGISFMLANAISKASGIGSKKLGDLTDQEREKLEDMVMNPQKLGLPAWMYNRRKDPKTGKDSHLTVSELEFTKKMDIDQMKKFKTYKGVRHASGLPVRGQRTRGSFRKGKTLGVSKKKEQPATKKKGDS